MSKYSVELRELIENGVDIGLKNYPIWSEDHRQELNNKIINHYKYREIGFETPGRFVDELNIKMDEIMPYYNKLYETTLYEYNPIHNVDYEEENTTTRDTTGKVENTGSGTTTNKETGTSKGNGTVTGSSSSESSSNSTNSITNNNKSAETDTPQSNIAFDSLTGGTLDYASKVSVNENKENGTQSNIGTATSNDSSTTNTTSELTNDFTSNTSNESETNSLQNQIETFKKRLKGNYGVTSSQNMIKQEREIILNIDMMIIKELRTLFMQVW